MATKKTTKKPLYPPDDGALTAEQVQQIKRSAPKAKKNSRTRSRLSIDVELVKPGTVVGNYSVRTVHDDGRVDLTIDWDLLKAHVASARV